MESKNLKVRNVLHRIKVKDVLHLISESERVLITIYDFSEGKRESYSDDPIYLYEISPEDKILDYFVTDMHQSFWGKEDHHELITVLSVSKPIQ